MQHLSLTCELIERAFGQALPLDLPVCEQALRQRLTGQLQQWIGQGLREQPEQLVQTCYRIDLPEEQFHAAMMARHPEEALARSVLAHMERKAHYRLHYGGQG